MRALILLLVSTTAAYADVAAPAPPVDCSQIKPGADAAKQARDRFMRAVNHYNLAEYDAAIREFTAAYCLMSTPELLFNIAQSHRQAGHPTDAVRLYRRYLALKPDTPNRAAVEKLIAELTQKQP